MKICTKCEVKKESKEFSKDKYTKDGLCYKCKNCVREHYKENKEKISQKNKEYYIENRAKLLEKKLEYDEKYRKENKEKIRKYNNRYCRERRKNDPVFRLQKSLRSVNHRVIKYGCKSASTQELLGCTWEEAKIHIENQFTEGMTWENWSINGWHIDHIRPIASFTDLTDPEQQRQCCHYTNLRPMWSEENLIKSSWWNEIKY